MTKTIPLGRGKFAIVDEEDYDRFKGQLWYCTSRGYAARNDGPRTVLMHVQIANTPRGYFTDHIDGNGLNNIRANLRVCTTAENCRNQKKRADNTSGFKGVSWHKHRQKWQARITLNYKIIHLGIHPTRELAAEAYREAAKKYHGEFSRI